MIDWEFAYVGPAQFVLDPPWWLLLEEPECWPGGIEEWSTIYERRLQTWLRMMQDAEDKRALEQSRLSNVDGLSTLVDIVSIGRRTRGGGITRLTQYMRESWETGRFWLNYAARKIWAFDTIYWKYLDKRFFGRRAKVENEAWWKCRIHLLSEGERRNMETLVEIKMKEKEERIIVDWDPEDARRYLARFLL